MYMINARKNTILAGSSLFLMGYVSILNKLTKNNKLLMPEGLMDILAYNLYIGPL